MMSDENNKKKLNEYNFFFYSSIISTGTTSGLIFVYVFLESCLPYVFMINDDSSGLKAFFDERTQCVGTKIHYSCSLSLSLALSTKLKERNFLS